MKKYSHENTLAQGDHANVEPVYDILNCGPRNRFYANGKLVHNSSNAQNLPSGRKPGQTDLLRRSIIAYPGYTTVNFDSSQIEVRVAGYIAQQHDLLAAFAVGEDPYLLMAATMFSRSVEELKTARKSPDPEVAALANHQRQVAKAAVLAAGYGQGAKGFQLYALVVMGISLSIEEAKAAVDAYRRQNYAIVQAWGWCDTAIKTMVGGGQMYFGGPDGKLFFVDGSRVVLGKSVPGIRLPSGTWLNYPNIRADESSSPNRPQFVYDKCGYNGKPLPSKVYPGLLFENLTQALAFDVMKEQGLWINHYYPIKLNTHDEWCTVVPREQAEHAAVLMNHFMSTAPAWVEGLPLASEGGWAQSYGGVDDNWADRPTNPNREHRFDNSTGEVY